MATLRDIQRRIRSVQSTQKITRAMKLVAAAKLRRAQERITGARPYARKMGELLGSVVSRAGDEGHPLLARRATGRKRLVIITADKGLCGAFNSNVLRASLQFLREGSQVDVTLVVVGKKSRDFYRRRPWTVTSEMLGFFDRLAFSHATELAGELMQAYLAEEVDEVHLIYNEFRSVAVQRVRREQLLPIPPPDHEPVVGDWPAFEHDDLPRRIDSGDLAHQHARVALAPDQVTDRPGDVGR